MPVIYDYRRFVISISIFEYGKICIYLGIFRYLLIFKYGSRYLNIRNGYSNIGSYPSQTRADNKIY